MPQSMQFSKTIVDTVTDTEKVSAIPPIPILYRDINNLAFNLPMTGKEGNAEPLEVKGCAFVSRIHNGYPGTQFNTRTRFNTRVSKYPVPRAAGTRSFFYTVIFRAVAVHNL
jgi:hypothetical protein